MATKVPGKDRSKVLNRRCPDCGGKCIRYGIVSWKSRGVAGLYSRYQRVRCNVCGQLTYHFIDVITVVNNNNGNKR